jgi:RNase P/RNase MRP subunit p29
VKRISYSEILGAEALVTYSADPSLIGKRGTIVGEGKNIVRLADGKRELKLLKWNIMLDIVTRNGERKVISGMEILGRPEERSKEIIRRKR